MTVNYIVNSDRLRSKMDEFGFSNARLADAADVSEGTIKRLLRGEITTRPTLKLVADAVGVSVDWLISSDDQAIPEIPQEISDSDPEQHDLEPSTRELIDRLEGVYQAQIESLEHRIEAIRELYFREHKEKHRIMIFAVVLVAFVCFWLTIDVINPSVGWLRK